MGQLFWSNVAKRCCLGTLPMRMGIKFLSKYFRSTVGLVSLTGLPIDGNIGQKVALCIITSRAIIVIDENSL